jgi:DNA (cytosine-5)-methyltransferase 1
MRFPGDFKFVGMKAEIARQVGNAGPPPFARAMVRVVFAGFQRLTQTA